MDWQRHHWLLFKLRLSKRNNCRFNSNSNCCSTRSPYTHSMGFNCWSFFSFRWWIQLKGTPCNGYVHESSDASGLWKTKSSKDQINEHWFRFYLSGDQVFPKGNRATIRNCASCLDKTSGQKATGMLNFSRGSREIFSNLSRRIRKVLWVPMKKIEMDEKRFVDDYRS